MAVVPRPPQVLAAQLDALQRYLRNAYWDHDAAYAWSPGGSVLQPGAGKRKRRPDARFTAEIARLHDSLPLHLREQMPAAWTHLTLKERFILHWAYVEDVSMKAIAAHCGLSQRTAWRHHHTGLERLARLLWDDQGACRWGLRPKTGG